MYLFYSLSKAIIGFLVLKRTTIKCKEPLDAWMSLVIINELSFAVYIILSLTANYSVMKERRLQSNVGRNPTHELYDSYFQRYNTNTLISELNNLDNYNHFAHINEEGENKYKFLTLMRHSNQL